MNEEKNQPVIPQTQAAPSYASADILFAWLSLLFGYLFCRAFPAAEHPMGAFAVAAAIFIVTFIVLKAKKVKIPFRAVIVAISAILVSGGLILSDNEFLSFIAHSYAIAAYCYFLSAACGNTIEGGFSDLILLDFIRALFVLPFRSFVKIFPVLAHGKAKSGAKLFGKILLGAAVTLIPTLIVFGLLSYDKGFTDLLDKIFTFDIDDVFSHMGSMTLALPLGMYLFGLFHSSVNQLMRGNVSAESSRNGLAKVQILPAATALTAVLPILFLYVVFFISQWQYYISGFTGVLPEGFSYAEYARQGFFELCGVSVVNVLILLALVIFMKRKKQSAPPLLKLLSLVFCLFTLVLISTAMAKLVLYIGYYGLTPKRIYAMWFMVIIALVYILIALGQFVSKAKAVAASFTVCVVLLAALCLCDVESISAQYNVDRYLSGDLETVDLEAMEEFGDSAIPSLVYLERQLLERRAYGTVMDETLTLLRERAEDMAENEFSVFDFTVPTYQARSALISFGLLEK